LHTLIKPALDLEHKKVHTNLKQPTGRSHRFPDSLQSDRKTNKLRWNL